jgi:hypothetical protein
MGFRKRINKLHLVFLSLFAVAVYAQQKGEWHIWNNADSTLSISYPDEWTEMKLNSGEIVAFVAPKTDVNDKYPDMMVLRVFSDSGIKDINHYKSFAQTTLSPKWNFKMTSSQKITAGKKEYIKSVAEDSKRNVVLVMYTLLKEDKIFFLTLNVEKRNYESYKSVGQRAFDSLTIGRLWIKD